MESFSRRSFLAASLPVAAAAGGASGLSGQTAPAGYLLFIGTYTDGSSKGIYAFRFDGGSGEMTPLGLAAETPDPTFLALSADHRFLYAVNEVSNYKNTHSGLVSGFAIDHLTGKLKPVNQVASAGSGPCHVAVDHTGSALFVANYGSGSAASFHLNSHDGEIGAPVSQFQHSGHGANPKRQEGPHAHCATVSPDNRYVLVNDLGLDRVVVYKLDAATAKLTPNDPPFWTAKPGSGPRHLAFHPRLPFAYLITEMASTVEVLAWDAQTGTLTSIQTVSSLPPSFKGESSGAEIAVDKAGEFVYASNRGDNSIAAFSVNQKTGKVTSIGFTHLPGREPRHFAIDPTGKWMLAGNQYAGSISIMQRNPQTGKISDNGKVVEIDKAVCLLFV